MADGGLGPRELLDHGVDVADQVRAVEGDLADAEVDVAHLVGAVLDAAGLELADGLADLHRDGPRLRVGHQPRGPSTRPSVHHLTHQVRRRDRDVEVQEPAPDLGHELVGPDLVGARLPRASVACSPAANATTRTVVPVPAGSESVPRTIWSALRGSTPSRTASSTVSSNFADASDFTRSSGLADGQELFVVDLLGRCLYRLPCCIVPPSPRP